MPNHTLGSRLRTARERARLSLEAVGRHLGITAQAVQQWEKDRTTPSTERLTAVAQLTGVNLQWLITGLVVSELGEQDKRYFGDIARGGRVVPKLSLARAVADPIDRTASATVHTHFPCSQKAFAITIFDRSNAPFFEIGDTVVIDPDATPNPGDMILAVVGPTAQPAFGKYTLKTRHAAALQPLNPDWPTIDIGEPGTRIVGVMTEHARPRRT
jgi:transcriptional regulator with XRE-family HTH domain